MSGTLPVLKKPKTEVTWSGEDEEIKTNREEVEEDKWENPEKEIIALLEYRTMEVERLRDRINYYKNELEEAEQRLVETKNMLGRIRERSSGSTTVISKSILAGKDAQVGKRSPSPAMINEGAKACRKHDMHDQESESPSLHSKYLSEKTSQSKPLLVIPTAQPKVSHSMRTKESEPGVAGASDPWPTVPSHSPIDGRVPIKEERPHKRSREGKIVESQGRATKQKLELKEHKELIPLIRSRSSPAMIRYVSNCISSQHKRKLRSLILCPASDQLFATSALDGVINLWHIQGSGSNANLVSTSDCGSAKNRRWPEDIAWHPQGNSIFSVYTGDGGDSQISILNLNKTKQRRKVTFMEEKPHGKGIINNIMFMPWDDRCFVTGGSDHAVVLWNEKDGEGSWKPKVLHKSIHTSAVKGVAGMQQKKIVLSAGADKRIVGFNLDSGRANYKHQTDSHCMSILPNPCDFNLFMVHTGSVQKQIRLFDIRLKQTQVHAFGWKQETSDTQSALVNQAWSPDGFHLTSGSADPVIHIFDIRYNAQAPSQSIRAHHKRVFKAVWHHACPLLISISSDLNIGLHKLI